MIGDTKPMPVFQTDFTYKKGAVCAMYGVCKSVDRTPELIDGTQFCKGLNHYLTFLLDQRRIKCI